MVASGSAIAVLLGNGDGTFKPAVKYPLVATGSPEISSFNFASGDFNGDGKADVVVISQNASGVTGATGALSVFLGRGGGTLQPAVNYPFSSGPCRWPPLGISTETAIRISSSAAIPIP